MSRRFAFIVISALLILGTIPADAEPVFWQLRCGASGSMNNFGDWEGSNRWEDLHARGTCMGHPSGPLTVTVTGTAEANYFFVCPMTVSPTLTLEGSGVRTRVIRQTWAGYLPNCFWPVGEGRGVVLNALGLQVGTAKWQIGPPDFNFMVQEISMRWRFLIRPWA